MKSKWINDGSENGVTGYFCECSRCNFWGVDKERVEQIEKLHFKKVEIIKEAEGKLLEIQREEAKILGLQLIEVSRK